MKFFVKCHEPNKFQRALEAVTYPVNYCEVSCKLLHDLYPDWKMDLLQSTL